MRFIPLVLRNLLRRKFRTVFTLGCIFISFVLYGFLMIVNAAFTMGIDFAGADRLWMMHKVSIIQFIPSSYLNTIMSTPGVTLSTHCTWFGGSYQGKPNQFAVFATDIPTYLKLYPEFQVAPDQLKALEADRQGVIIGKDTASLYKWKIGDRIPIQADIWQPVQGNTWYFNVVGIYDGGQGVDKTQFLFRYDYFDENRRANKGVVSWYVIKVADPAAGAAIAAKLDGGFANSQAETKTAPEKAVIADFAKQTGNIGGMITAILSVVFFIILLVVANTMAQSVRERTSELAVLKTLGFGDTRILILVMAESLFIAVLGGFSALTLMYYLVGRGSFNMAMLPVFAFTTSAILTGAALVVALGLLAGALPAVGAMRLKITDALRRN
jgi:putative ABC transport system permease protein